jgi:hypothetical protein
VDTGGVEVDAAVVPPLDEDPHPASSTAAIRAVVASLTVRHHRIALRW